MRIYAPGAVTAAAESRTLSGTVVRYGVPGRTSAGLLKVKPGALRFPDDLTRVKLTREHDRDSSRGHLVSILDGPDGIRATLKVSDGPDGDAALLEATDRTRDGFSYDVVDVQVDGDTITSALVIAIGQVGIPAYDESRIDTIAASHHTTAQEGTAMTDDQRARLTELRAQQTLTQAEAAELAQLAALEENAADPVEAPAAETQPVEAPAVAASMPAVPAGLPRTGRVQVRESGANALNRLVREVTAALKSAATGGSALPGITAAFSDVIHTDHTGDVEPVAWSGELWSGLEYQPVFSDLLTPGPLTNWEGKGWRFVTTPAMQDYAGDKTAVPTGTVTTEASSYEAARMAVGVDIDRKFYDFPNEAFVRGLLERIRESWEIGLDAKAEAYIETNARGYRTAAVGTTSGDATITAAAGTFHSSDVGTPISGNGIPTGATIASVTDSDEAELSAVATATGAAVTATFGYAEDSVIKAAARAAMLLGRRRVGRPGWVVLNDEDMFSLLDVTDGELPTFLDLYGIDPRNFRSSPNVAQGTLLAGVRSAAVLRTLPGSPIRVSAQNLANGGVDEAFFGYWAAETHHESGIVSVGFTPPAA